MRTHRSDPGEPNWLKRAWRWLRSSGHYAGYEADQRVTPKQEEDGQKKERSATAARARLTFWPPR